MKKLILITLLIPTIVWGENYGKFHCRITQLIDHQTYQPVEINPRSVIEFNVEPTLSTNLFLKGLAQDGPYGPIDIKTGIRDYPHIMISKLDYTFDGTYVFYKQGELASGFCKEITD